MCLNHIFLINWSQNGWKSSPEMIYAKKKNQIQEKMKPI